MRLVSQDGMFDVPYETSALSIGYGEPNRKYEIYIRSKLLDEKPCVFATYSTKEKALKVMEMVRDAYVGLPIVIQNMEIGNDALEKLKEWKIRGIMIQTFENEPSKFECINNRVFRFPSDEEVE